MKMPVMLAGAGFTMAAFSGIAVMMSGLGTRWGWWEYQEGFMVLRGATICAIVAIAISLAAVFVMFAKTANNGIPHAVLGLLIGIIVAAIPLSLMHTARSVPRINDITTDTDDPPRFVAVIPLRIGASTSTEYGGPGVAKQQRAAYPGVVPFELPLPPDKAYDLALAAVRKMGWAVVAESGSDGRIEATDTTFWFGFTDDIVVRIRPDGNGSRIDVRSHSRVGLGDLGANAKRITAYLAAVKAMQ